jgi:PhoPQ-activated pathogenicity-related protein
MQWVVLVASLFFVGVSSAQEGSAPATGKLKEFSKTIDDSYRFEVVEKRQIGSSRVARLHMVSQKWKEMTWKHVVWVIVPNKAIEKPQDPSSRSAILLVDGGGWRKEWGEDAPPLIQPRAEFQVLKGIAEATGSPAIVVSQVPFQPMLGDLNEDALIAETFKRFIQGEGDDWPLLMPMVRSAVRAMDTAQKFAKDEHQLQIDKFTITGASKRGWTTWLTSAVDSRIHALAPMVIDMLNMPVQMEHQKATWGTYSDEIGDYTELSLQKFMKTKQGESLIQIVDPYRYRDRIDQPKLLIFGTNDRYWPLDACNNYWAELRGEKYLLYTPNQGHSIQDIARVAGSICALHKSRCGQGVLPKLDWKTDLKDGRIHLSMQCDTDPQETSIWIARSDTRDFRNASWTSLPAKQIESRKHTAEVAMASDQYVAAFGEWVFDGGALPAFFSTNVVIAEPTSTKP